MYKFSRFMLMCAVLLLGYSLVMISLTNGWLALICLCALIIACRMRTSTALTTLGSARLATENEMRRTGMMGGRGLILGTVPKKNLLERIKGLFRQTPDKGACLQFLGERELITLPPSTNHVACFGPTGSGKGVSLIIPWLLSVNESAVVVDYKGENALLTADARRRMGQRIVILDPFKMVTK